MSDLLRRARAGLDLRRLAAGERRHWTIRLEHAVHLVRLDETPMGNVVYVDGREVGRTDPWTYDAVVRFEVGGRRAILRSETDNARGTLRTELVLDGIVIPPDARYRGEPARRDLKLAFERSAYVLAAALVAAGMVGQPVAGAVHHVVWVGGYVLLTFGLAAIDPFLFFPVLIDKAIEDRPSMVIVGLEIAVLAALARDRRGIRRRIPFLREQRLLPRVLGWTVVGLVAFIVLAIS